MTVGHKRSRHLLVGSSPEQKQKAEGHREAKSDRKSAQRVESSVDSLFVHASFPSLGFDGELVVFGCEFEVAFSQMLRTNPGKLPTFRCPRGISLRSRQLNMPMECIVHELPHSPVCWETVQPREWPTRLAPLVPGEQRSMLPIPPSPRRRTQGSYQAQAARPISAPHAVPFLEGTTA